MDPIDDLKAAYGDTSTTQPSADPVEDLKAAFSNPKATTAAPTVSAAAPSDNGAWHVTIGGPKTLGDITKSVTAPLMKAALTYDPQAVAAGVQTGIADIPASLSRVPGIADTGIALAHGYANAQGTPINTTRDQDLQTIADANTARNNQFDAKYQNNPWAQGGRVGGEILASSPFLAAGGEALEAAGSSTDGTLPAIARFAAGDTNGLVGGTASKLAAGAGQGLATTGLTNAGSNDSLSDQAERNMVIGGGLRTLVPALTGTGSFIINKLKGLAQGPSSQADNLLLQSITRDGYTPETAAAKLQSMGPDATIGDLGENTRGLMRTVAGTPSEGKNAITNFVENRQVGDDEIPGSSQSGRILQSANEGLGVTSADPEQAIEQLQESQQKASAPLYKEAFSNNKSVQSPVIDRILKTDFGKSALSGARDRMNTKMSLMAVPDKELTEQAADAGIRIKGGVASGLKLQTLDLVKQDMDDQIGAAIKKVAKGDMRKGELNDMMDMRKAFINELDANDVTAKAGPNSFKPEGGAYARARAAYAGPAKSLEAIEMGQDFIKNPNSVNAAQLAKMSPGDKVFARQGVANALQDTLMNTPDGADAVKKIMGSPAKRKQLATFFDTPEAFTKFKQTIENEAEKFKTYKVVTGGSPTIPRLNEQADAGMSANDALELAGHAVTGNHVGFVGKIANKLLNNKPSFGAEQANALAPRILPGSDQAEALSRLGKLNFDQSRRFARSKAIDSFAGAYGAPAAMIGVNRLRDITGAK